VELDGCNNNIGYRQMWAVLRQKHGLSVKQYTKGQCMEEQCYVHAILYIRNTVQMLMSVLDPDGVKRWKGHRLKRRIYQNKVS